LLGRVCRHASDIHEFEKIFHVLAAMEAVAGKDKK